MSDETDAELAQQLTRVGWLKANVMPVALGVQMAVLVGALVALGLGMRAPLVPPPTATHQEPAAPGEATDDHAQAPEGEVATAHGKGAGDAHGKSADDAHGKSADDAHGKSADDAHGKSADDAHGKSADDAHAKSPADEKSPDDAHGKSPDDAHGKSPADAPGKSPAEAPVAASTRQRAAAEATREPPPRAGDAVPTAGPARGATPTAAGGAPAAPADALSPLEQAIAELTQGNERFAQGVTRQKDPVALRRSPGRPQAVVVACTDAAVPPELVFDQALGSLVVVRSPAQLVDEGALAAVEDAVTRLQVPLVVVLGHQGCHAVHVAAKGAKAGPGLATITGRLAPMVKALRTAGRKGEALVSAAIDGSVGLAAVQLTRRSKVLRASQVPVVRAVYDEATGQVRWLDLADDPAPLPAHAARSTR